MILPNMNNLENWVRHLVDFCVSKGYSFTCWDLTRQLQHHYVGQKIDHNAVRAAVEKYFFEPGYGDGFKKNSGYDREVTFDIVGAPQVYKPKDVSVSKYDKDFLDPLRVEKPKVVEKSLVEKVKDEIATGKATEASLMALIGIVRPQSKPEHSSLAKVYAVKDTANNVWASTKTSSGQRRWVKNVADANFYGQKYRTAALIRANPGRKLEPVEFNLS